MERLLLQLKYVSWLMSYDNTRDPTIILEIVVSYDLWKWHAFFGLPGSHNDINILERSFVFSELEGRAPPVNYSINGNDYISIMGNIFQNNSSTTRL